MGSRLVLVLKMPDGSQVALPTVRPTTEPTSVPVSRPGLPPYHHLPDVQVCTHLRLRGAQASCSPVSSLRQAQSPPGLWSGRFCQTHNLSWVQTRSTPRDTRSRDLPACHGGTTTPSSFAGSSPPLLPPLEPRQLRIKTQ